LKNIQDLLTPAAIIDIERLERNISNMATKAKENQVHLRPHIKTHKSIDVGQKQVEAGATGITVSTLGEAEAFADAGFGDILYAVPLANDKFDKVKSLSEKTTLSLIVDHPIIVEQFGAFCKEMGISTDILVKVDCGYHRCGVDPKSPAAVSLVKKITDDPNLNFKGILTHAGHSYEMTTVQEIKSVAMQEQNVMIDFANTLKMENTKLAPQVVSIGSTPTIQLADTLAEGITEIRPGSYVFFDYTQVALGACEVTDCSFTVLSSVVSVSPDRSVIDAGATALSKDRGPIHLIPDIGYGMIIQDYPDGAIDPTVVIESLSQEHGKLIFTGKTSFGFPLGEKIRIIPNHSCLSANLFDHYFVAKGDSVVDMWKICKQR
jgi:D-serine deaminase-like pyridoxal phosphate-dependent protein